MRMEIPITKEKEFGLLHVQSGPPILHSDGLHARTDISFGERRRSLRQSGQIVRKDPTPPRPGPAGARARARGVLKRQARMESANNSTSGRAGTEGARHGRRIRRTQLRRLRCVQRGAWSVARLRAAGCY